jgi:hypothetical protein
LKFILEKVELTRLNNSNNNTQFESSSKFIIMRGYETITNIFNIMLYYTKNLDLTFYHCQKAYYYYIEFIEQISKVDHIFLQLNSRDATTYVYKKTLYEIDDDVKKVMLPCSNNIKFSTEIIDENIKIFNNIFNFLLNFLDLHLCTSELYKEDVITTKIIDKFKIICEKILLFNTSSKNKNKDDIKRLYNEIYDINNSFLTHDDNTNTSLDFLIDKYFEIVTLQLK